MDSYPYKLHCADCGIRTKHDVLHNEIAEIESDDSTVASEAHHVVARCRACDGITLALATFENGESEPSITTLRGSTSTVLRREVDDVYEFPDDVQGVYSEVITVFNTYAPRATGILLRTLVEAVCRDQDCKEGNLKVKIDHFTEMGLLSLPEAQMLHLLRYMGNAAAHDGEEPDWEEVELGLDIIEHLLMTIYVVLPKAAEIQRGQERREKAKTRAKERSKKKAGGGILPPA